MSSSQKSDFISNAYHFLAMLGTFFVDSIRAGAVPFECLPVYQLATKDEPEPKFPRCRRHRCKVPSADSEQPPRRRRSKPPPCSSPAVESSAIWRWTAAVVLSRMGEDTVPSSVGEEHDRASVKIFSIAITGHAPPWSHVDHPDNPYPTLLQEESEHFCHITDPPGGCSPSFPSTAPGAE
ncbi:hypothetical protein MRX96_000172 [Rhipicephalus microplus]